MGDAPRPLFSCTPSRLAAWLDCPARYRMVYLDRPRPRPGPPWAHNSLGASVHNALAGWWRLPRARRDREHAGQLLGTGWLTDGYRDEAQSAVWRERARLMVERYAETLDAETEPVGVERTVAVRTPRLALSGRVDRIDDRPDGLVVVDYKTGRRPLTAHDARTSMALALYAITVSATLRRPCRRVELHHLPTGDVLTHEHTEESLRRQLARAEQIADDVQAASSALARGEDVFVPRPGPQCGWCDYRAHCAVGRQASPARASWDGLGADDGSQGDRDQRHC